MAWAAWCGLRCVPRGTALHKQLVHRALVHPVGHGPVLLGDRRAQGAIRDHAATAKHTRVTPPPCSHVAFMTEEHRQAWKYRKLPCRLHP